MNRTNLRLTRNLFAGSLFASPAWVGAFVFDMMHAGTIWPVWPIVHALGLGVSLVILFTNLSRLLTGEGNGLHRRTHEEVYVHPLSPAAPASWAIGIPSLATTVKTSVRSLAQPRAIEGSGLVVGEVEAWRCWQVVGDYLASCNGVIWLPDQPMRGDGVDINNGSGVHAFKDFDAAKAYAAGYGLMAVGVVHLWGTVVEHETGYRAEFGRPVSIECFVADQKIFQDKGRASRIREHYGMEIT